MGSTLSKAVHVGISRALMYALVPFLIAIGIVSGERSKIFIKVFIKQSVHLFGRGSCRGIGTIGLVVNVGAAIGVREDGEMIGGVGL